MIHLTNLISLLLTVLWNASMLLGTIWLILEKDWSPFTLVATFLFFARWRTLPEEPKEKKVEEASKILL